MLVSGLAFHVTLTLSPVAAAATLAGRLGATPRTTSTEAALLTFPALSVRRTVIVLPPDTSGRLVSVNAFCAPVDCAGSALLPEALASVPDNVAATTPEPETVTVASAVGM